VSAWPLETRATDTSDQALLSDMRHGDERAFEQLFHRHYAGVYGVVLRIVGAPEEAEEIAHDAFLKLYRQPIAGDDANVRAWLYRVATNAAFNAVRSRRRRRGWLQRLAGRAEVREHADDPATLVGERDEAERLRELLAARRGQANEG
jgi:RNA polymerase sigma-70 factor (ECF subfamily)